MTSIITLKDLEKPINSSIEKDIDWLCKSFGFVSNRDSEETASKIFKAIVLSINDNKELTSEEIAKNSNITRGAALLHIKNYIDSGLIVQKKTKYILRRRSLTGTVEEIELDAERMFDNIKNIAKELDFKIGFTDR